MVIPLSDLAGLDICTKNGVYPLLFVNVRFKFFKCTVYVLLPSAKERYCSSSSPESFEHPPNLELNLKRNEMECAGYKCSVAVWCVLVLLSCKCPSVFVILSLCYSCALSVQRSVCVHYSFGNIQLIEPFYFRWVFVATGPCSLQIRSCVQSVSQIWRTGDFATGHNICIFGDVRWPNPAKCDRTIRPHWVL